MGNISCLQPQAINTSAQQVYQPQEQDAKISAGIDFINLLNQNIQKKFFLDFKPSLGIEPFIGINVQNLSLLHNFIKQIKLKDHQASIMKLPDQKKLAYQNHINTQCDIIVDEVKTALFQLKKNTKKNIKALNFHNRSNQSRSNTNFINTPYYLPWIQSQDKHVCVYVGEWKYQSRFLMRNFPSGIGRLYINNQVWQGEIQLSVDKLQHFNISTVQSIQQNLSNPQTTTKQNINMIKNNLTLQLNGLGRKFTKDDQYSGNFSKGVLNGKGQYKNCKHQYTYEGNWFNNIKSGKGIETTKTSRYQGEWKDNFKNGQGTLIFYISTQLEKERLKEQKIFDQLNQNHAEYKHRKARVIIQMNLQELSDREIRQTLTKSLPKYKGEQLLTFQTHHYTPWQITGFPFINKNFVQNIKFQQLMKTNFCQKYTGEFLNDQFHGKGMYQWVKGNFYVGDWINGKMEGKGKFYWKEGYVYWGEYKNDLKHGRGQMKWDPYKRHRGNWAFGKKHGYGEEIKIELNENQQLQVVIVAGLWKNNNLDKKDIFFSKCFPIQNNPNYVSYSSILKHNYYFYHPQAKITPDAKFKIVSDQARNYFRNPCNYCGSYIRKEELVENNTYLDEVFKLMEVNNKTKQQKNMDESEQQPQICKNCAQKLKQLEKISQKHQDQRKEEE